MPREHAPFDRWTAAHAAIGAVYGRAGFSAPKAFVLSVAFEAVEAFFVDESPANIAADLAANMAGWWIGRRFRPQGGGSEIACPANLGLEHLERFSQGAAAEQSLPMVIVLHSRAATPKGSAALHGALRTPARVLTPQAPTKLGGGYAWFLEHLGTKDQDALAGEIAAVGPRLAAFVRDAARCKPTVGKPIVTGSSQGGAMALYLASWYPDLIGGAVAVNGWLPQKLWRTPMAPTVVLSGEDDATVRPERTQAYAREMRSQGAPVTFDMLPSGHEISKELGSAWKSAVNAMVE